MRFHPSIRMQGIADVHRTRIFTKADGRRGAGGQHGGRGAQRPGGQSVLFTVCFVRLSGHAWRQLFLPLCMRDRPSPDDRTTSARTRQWLKLASITQPNHIAGALVRGGHRLRLHIHKPIHPPTLHKQTHTHTHTRTTTSFHGRCMSMRRTPGPSTSTTTSRCPPSPWRSPGATATRRGGTR